MIFFKVFLVLLLVILHFCASENAEKVKEKKNLVNKDTLTGTIKSTNKKDVRKTSPMKETVDSLLRGMELSTLKRSVDNILKKETVDISKFIKLEKKKKGIKAVPDWLKRAVKEDKPMPDWLKKEVIAADSLKKETTKKDTNKPPEMPEFLKKAIQEDETKKMDKKVLKELSEKEVYKTFDESEKRTVDRFIDALKVVSKEETKLKIKKELKKSTTKKETSRNYAIDDKGKCEDEEKDCHLYNVYCDSYPDQMKTYCPKTCGFCTSGCEPDISHKEQCEKIQEMGYCKQSTAQLLCATTCLCESCENSLYGCCWDKKTLKNDHTGSNCPECKNKYDVSICSIFKKDCKSKNDMAKQWMMKNCMETCGLCSVNPQQQHYHALASNEIQPTNQQTCNDEKAQSEFCPLWKSAGWCEEKEELMEKLCAKTCYNCHFIANNLR